MLKLPLAYRYRAAQAETGDAWLLVLMHGVGSHADDLFALAGYVPSPFHVLSLQAPLAMGPDAYAWFPFSVLADGRRAIDAAQEQQSRAAVVQSVQQACAQLGIPAQRVVLGGFSQGGIMALSVLLTQPDVLAAVCIWHSRLLPEVLHEQVPMPSVPSRTAWVSHGTQDAVIALGSAHTMRDYLQHAGVTVTYREYPCPHTIHPQELRDSMNWLQGLRNSPQP